MCDGEMCGDQVGGWIYELKSGESVGPRTRLWGRPCLRGAEGARTWVVPGPVSVCNVAGRGGVQEGVCGPEWQALTCE